MKDSEWGRRGKIRFKEKVIGGTFEFNIPIKIDYFSDMDKEEARATCEIILRDMEGSEAQAEFVSLLKRRAEKIKEKLHEK